MATEAARTVDAFLDAVELGTISSCSVWSSDALLDATTPGWRFQMRGPDEIRAEYAHWFADPGRFEELRRIEIPGGEVVEYLLTWTENGVPHAAHHLHVLEVSDGLIVVDTVMCGGRWPASLLADMQTSQLALDARHRQKSHVHS